MVPAMIRRHSKVFPNLLLAAMAPVGVGAGFPDPAANPAEDDAAASDRTESLTEVPDLAPSTRIALEATPDGRDLRDEAWHRLANEASSWPRTRSAFDRVTVVHPRWRDVLEDPDRFRGALLEATGRLEQVDPVETPGISSGEYLEWFVRVESGDGGGVVQVFLPAIAAENALPGRTVTVVGRFLRRTELQGRDGATRSFATIVGVPLAAGATSSGSPGWGVALATLILVPLALWARRLARRSRARPSRSIFDAAERTSLREDLPRDPAEALEVLAAEGSGRDR